MNKKKFLIIGYGNMGRLHSEILSDLLNDVFFDVVDIEDKKIGKQKFENFFHIFFKKFLIHYFDKI